MSPSSWPSVSLIDLKSSMSSSITATERRSSAAPSRASWSVSDSEERFGSPVNASWCARWLEIAACRPPKYTASIGTKHTGTSATLALAEASSAGAKASTQPAVQAWKARSSRR